jgi:arsenate reductase
MAEGFARILAPTGTTIFSAGSEPDRLDPMAVRVMAELNVDISKQFPKGLGEVPTHKVDTVVTLCGEASELCPALPSSARRLHWPVEDPSKVSGTEQERLRAYRQTRKRILNLVCEMFDPTAPT